MSEYPYDIHPLHRESSSVGRDIAQTLRLRACLKCFRLILRSAHRARLGKRMGCFGSRGALVAVDVDTSRAGDTSGYRWHRPHFGTLITLPGARLRPWITYLRKYATQYTNMTQEE